MEYGNVPQNRERIYIVGFLSEEECNKFSFPDKVELTNQLESIIDFHTKLDEKYYYTPGPYEPNPKLTTGAGDNFNAGFCFGQVLGLSTQLSLVLGTATSGYYVRNAKSPTLKDIITFLNYWENSLN